MSATPARRSVDPDRLVDQQAVLLHLLVERGAVDVEDPGGLLAVPVEGLEGLDDDPLLGLLEGFLERADARRQVGPGGVRGRRRGTVAGG